MPCSSSSSRNICSAISKPKRKDNSQNCVHGWFLAMRHALPLSFCVHQGEAIGRPSRLYLNVDEKERVFVSGRVEELGNGVIRL